jgi:hypothetical protein
VGVNALAAGPTDLTGLPTALAGGLLDGDGRVAQPLDITKIQQETALHPACGPVKVRGHRRQVQRQPPVASQ